MMKKVIFFWFVLLTFIFAHAQTELNDDISSAWGLNIGLGVNSFTRSTSTLRVLSPGYVKIKHGGWLRFYADANINNLVPTTTAEDESFVELGVGVSIESPLKNDFFGYYTKIGIGTASLPDDFYDGSVMTLPIALGLNFYGGWNEKRSFWDPIFNIEYRRSFTLNYKDSKEVVAGSDALFGSGLYFGLTAFF